MKRYIGICVIAITLVLGMTSCDSFKKAQGNDKNDEYVLDPITGKRVKKKKNPKQGNNNTKVVEEMETVVWRENPSEQPPITSEGVEYTIPAIESPPTDPVAPTNPDTPPTGTLLSSYRVAVLLPFLSDRFNTNGGKVYEPSKTAIHLYGGMKMAMEELESEGVRLEVSVLDNKGSASTTASLLSRSEVQNANLIVGPVRTENVKRVAAFAKERKIPIVSPLNPSAVVEENPYYVQVSPGLQTHCTAITQHVLERYDADQVVLVCRNKPAEVARLQYFQDAHRTIKGTAAVSPFKEYIISEISPDYSNIMLDNYLHPTKKTVFVIPSWSSESFINTILRVMRIAKSRKQIVVYGMPKWMEYEKISYDYYEELNVHVSSDSYVDMNDPQIQAFRMDYFNKYGEAPHEYALVGYDLMLYVGRLLKESGTQFQQEITQKAAQYLHTKFAFQPVFKEATSTADETFTIRQYENKFVNILEFKDYYFQKAD